jgi:uncharacterized membrane protein YdjX (TVP38/TMEM64 family)
MNSATAIAALRNLGSAVVTTARQIPPWKIVAVAVVIVAFATVAIVVPVPTAVEVRDWARSMGGWFPLAFLAAHIVVTVFPFPRTAFTLAAGLLFGTTLGVTLAILASTLSAVIAVVLVRALGWQLSRLVSHPAVEAVNARLRQRGWPVVMSLRLIPAVPFSMINYAAGASAVRMLPYALATVIGLSPGTLAVVVLGDAFTGHVSPLLVVVSLVTACLGLAILALDLRAHRRERAAVENASAPAVSI